MTELNEYGCNCGDGWSGKFCEQQQELNCEDEIDNDKGEQDQTLLFSQNSKPNLQTLDV